MNNFIKAKINYLFFRRNLKRYLSPDQETVLRSKKIFLTEFKKTNPVTNSFFSRIPFTKHALKYGFFSFLALVVMGGSVIVYADQTNVGPDHPLYNLKKVSEGVQVRLATPEQAPDLHYKLAEKRIAEIKNIQSDYSKDDKAKEEKVKNLSNELEEEIDSALSKLDEINKQKPDANIKKKKLCKSLAVIISDHKKIISEYPDFQEDYTGFNKQCSEIFE